MALLQSINDTCLALLDHMHYMYCVSVGGEGSILEPGVPQQPITQVPEPPSL